MGINRGDRVDYMGSKGVVRGTYYMYTLGKRYVDVYFEDTKETVSMEANLLKKI